ncbi:MAG TPA: hypothetical protein VM939_07840 [Gemmatimonadaceae bacterium]|nr:hypothetical protein [Gemmatimonadaceae bacterium]
MTSSHRLFAALLCAVAACMPLASESSGEITIQTARDTYGPGETVVVTMINGGVAALEYNSCPTRLERREGDKWILLESLMSCSEKGFPLAPNAQAVIDVKLDDSVQRGIYRYRFGFIRVNDAALPDERIVSNVFEIK